MVEIITQHDAPKKTRFLGLALGPSHPNTGFEKEDTFHLSRERGSDEVTISGSRTIDGTINHIFFNRREGGSIISTETLRLKLQNIRQPANKTIKAILFLLAANRALPRFDTAGALS